MKNPTKKGRYLLKRSRYYNSPEMAYWDGKDFIVSGEPVIEYVAWIDVPDF